MDTPSGRARLPHYREVSPDLSPSNRNGTNLPSKKKLFISQTVPITQHFTRFKLTKIPQAADLPPPFWIGAEVRPSTLHQKSLTPEASYTRSFYTWNLQKNNFTAERLYTRNQIFHTRSLLHQKLLHLEFTKKQLYSRTPLHQKSSLSQQKPLTPEAFTPGIYKKTTLQQNAFAPEIKSFTPEASYTIAIAPGTMKKQL